MDAATVLKVVGPAFLGLVAWVLRNLFVKINRLCDDVLTIKVVLMGPTGENGLRSDVRGHSDELEAVNSRLDRAGIE